MNVKMTEQSEKIDPTLKSEEGVSVETGEAAEATVAEAEITDLYEPWLLGRSKKEYSDRLPDLGIISQLVIAIIFWKDCDAIPNLNVMVLTFAIVSFVISGAKFIGRTDKLEEEGVSTPAGSFVKFMGMVVLGVGIWGAAITFGKFDKMGSEDGECAIAIFLTAFIPAVIICSIFVGILFYGLALSICGIKKSASASLTEGDVEV